MVHFKEKIHLGFILTSPTCWTREDEILIHLPWDRFLFLLSHSFSFLKVAGLETILKIHQNEHHHMHEKFTLAPQQSERAAAAIDSASSSLQDSVL